MSRPDFLKKWASSRPSIPAISDPDYALGFANYLGAIPPSTDDHDYIMNLQDQRAVWLGEQMLNAVGHEWQDDVTYDAYAVVRSPVNGQLYRSLVGSNLGNEPSVSLAQWSLGVQPQSVDYLNTTRIDVASASTVDLTALAPDTRHIRITGTATINGFTVSAGQCYFVTFASTATLVNSASIVTGSGSNITAAANDTCVIYATASSTVQVMYYTPAIPKELGYRQTWQNVTASRVSGTIYTNTTGRSIFVLINIFWSDATDNLTLNVDGLPVVYNAEGGFNAWSSPISVIIPPGSTYNLTSSGSLAPISLWMELR